MMMYYRKDLFEDFGIEPADLSTWGELAEVGARLMDNHSQRLLALDGTLFDASLEAEKVRICLTEKESFCLTKRWPSKC